MPNLRNMEIETETACSKTGTVLWLDTDWLSLLCLVLILYISRLWNKLGAALVFTNRPSGPNLSFLSHLLTICHFLNLVSPSRCLSRVSWSSLRQVASGCVSWTCGIFMIDIMGLFQRRLGQLFPEKVVGVINKRQIMVIVSRFAIKIRIK